jgi:purine-binding chemotaxis protein CheW
LLDRLLAEAETGLGGAAAQGARAAGDQAQQRVAGPWSTAETGERYLLISLAGKEYALPASGVVEVGVLLRVSRVPNVPAWLLGLANVRGDIVSVVDLRAFLGLGDAEAGRQSRMVMVRTAAGDLTTILVVDRVRSIRRLSPTDNTNRAVADPRIAAFVAGVSETALDASARSRLLILLDLERLLQSTELRELEQA